MNHYDFRKSVIAFAICSFAFGVTNANAEKTTTKNYDEVSYKPLTGSAYTYIKGGSIAGETRTFENSILDNSAGINQKSPENHLAFKRRDDFKRLI